MLQKLAVKRREPIEPSEKGADLNSIVKKK
jgi:hypothetical protein